MSADEGYIVFGGGTGQEAEDFIVAVKRRAYSKGKHNDNSWIANFVSVCFERKALRWYESLDHETQNDWNLLKRAILEEYKDATLLPSMVPTSAPALNSSDQRAFPAAASPFRIRTGRIRVECGLFGLDGYISNSFDDDNWCTVTENQSTPATFEFDLLARTLKFQGTTDDYLAARLSDSNWEPDWPCDNYAAVEKSSGQKGSKKWGWSTLVRVDIWWMTDDNTLVGRWPLALGGLWELETFASAPDRRIYLAKDYLRYGGHFGWDDTNDVTLYLETLS